MEFWDLIPEQQLLTSGIGIGNAIKSVYFHVWDTGNAETDIQTDTDRQTQTD